MRNNRMQYYAVICCNLLAMSFGGVCAWASVNFLLLQEDNSPVHTGKLMLNEAAAVVSSLTFGGICGNILFGALSERYGRKIPLMCAAIPQFISWLLILWPRNVYHLLMGRILAGLAGGAVYVLIPSYTAEIADDHNRGTLGSLLNLTCNVGMLLELVLAIYTSYETQAKIFLAISAAFPLLFSFFPESPAYLLSKEKFKLADKSHRFYGKIEQPVKDIPLLLKTPDENVQKTPDENMNVENISTKIVFSDFKTRVALKSILISVGLVGMLEFSGLYVLLNFSVAIFSEAGSALSANTSAAVIGAIQIVGSYVSVHLADKAGRKFLLVMSALGTSLGLFIVALYNYLKVLNYSVEEFNWIPLVSLSFVIFVSNCGILALPFIVITEILPEKIRNVTTSACMTLMWILAFLVIGSYTTMVIHIGLHGCLLFFSICNLIGGLFVLFYLPETKGRSHEAIMQLLDK